MWRAFKAIFYDTIKEWFFSDVFICFNLDREMLAGRVEHFKRGKTLEVVNRIYAVKNGVIPIKALKDAQDFTRIYPFSYLCGMAKSLDQGVCKKEYLEHYAPVPKKELVVLEVDQYYFFIPKKSLKEDIQAFENTLFKADYIFSPFLLMYGYIRSILAEEATLYAMLEYSRLSVLITHHKRICHSKCYLLKIPEVLSAPTQEPQGDYEQEEALLKSLLSSMEADLTHMDAATQGLQDKSGLDSEISPEVQEMHAMLEEDLACVPDIVECLQESLKMVYTHPMHPLEDFVEKVCILNTYQVGPRMLAKLQEGLMLDVSCMPISVVEQLSIFARREQDDHAL
ncbi:hypothetical protein [Helicobacter salomonis]|uniref:hypothetical protein n=1 Tax=Helicobacter salomonis TaxID=56878 RepID=UPI000CF0EB41|nr:hypothetical protein [Helicobacter salomonis]